MYWGCSEWILNWQIKTTLRVVNTKWFNFRLKKYQKYQFDRFIKPFLKIDWSNLTRANGAPANLFGWILSANLINIKLYLQFCYRWIFAWIAVDIHLSWFYSRRFTRLVQAREGVQLRCIAGACKYNLLGMVPKIYRYLQSTVMDVLIHLLKVTTM